MSAAVEVLPFLPQGWLDGIAAGDYVERARGEVGSAKSAWAWIKKRPDAKGDPCTIMGNALAVGLDNLAAGGSAHDELTARTYQLISLGAEGHRGSYRAVVEFGRAFVRTVSGERRSDALEGKETGTVRSEPEAKREVGRAVLGAVKLMLGHLQQPEMVEAGLGDGAAGCSCWDEPKVVGPDGTEMAGQAGKAKDPFLYPLTETGNAEHLVDLVNGSMVWVPGEKVWFGFDEDHHHWRAGEYLGMEWARRLAPRVLAAAEQRFRAAEGLDTSATGSTVHSDAEVALIQGKKLYTWGEKCGSRANMANSLEVMKSFPGVVVPAERFDGNGRLLGVGGGEVLELNDDGLVVRKAEREDYLTKSTSVPYVPGATDALWEDTLERFVPDPAVRDYLQRLLGYSLIGGNPRRFLVFLQGPTSSGKSTLVEAVGAALGEYGGAIGLSVFREKQDDAPRPDLLRALSLRMAFASESGSEWYLHADQIKRLTGGDSISARNMHARDMVIRVPQFTPFIATNAAPRIEHADMALWRRLLVVPFDATIGASEDIAARDRLRSSSEARIAVLAWLVRGWEMQRANGLDDVPPAMLQRVEDFKPQVSDFSGWFHEYLEFEPGAYSFTDALFERYTMTAAEYGISGNKQLSKIMFAKALTAMGVQPHDKSKDFRKKADGKTARIRRGIRIKKS